MGMAKKDFTDHEISVEDVKLGIDHLMKWGKKSFKDHTGEWVEVCTSGQLHLFGEAIEPIAHLTEAE